MNKKTAVQRLTAFSKDKAIQRCPRIGAQASYLYWRTMQEELLYSKSAQSNIQKGNTINFSQRLKATTTQLLFCAILLPLGFNLEISGKRSRGRQKQHWFDFAHGLMPIIQSAGSAIVVPSSQESKSSGTH